MPTTMKLIAKNVLGSSASSVTFSDIPGTYTDLVLVMSARGDTSSDNGIYVQFNSDTANNYNSRFLYGDGASATSSNLLTFPRALIGYKCRSTNTSNTFGSSEAYIPNYAGSTAKSFSATAVEETNASTAYVVTVAGSWSGTAAITSIKLFEGTTNFVSGSSFFLYGITKS